MSDHSTNRQDTELDEQADLQTVLGAWHTATLRLERTHESLRGEVQRLTQELEIKNRQLARKNRLADLGQIATHVAHEVRNNLVPVTLYLSLLRRQLSDQDNALSVLTKIESGCSALEVCVNDLLHFASEREPKKMQIGLTEFIGDLLTNLTPQFDAQAIDAHCDIPIDLELWADPDMIRSAVMNLILNAVDAMPDGGELVITGVAVAGGVELEVADSGRGVDDPSARRVFEPFFTTKGSGTGLGLAVVERVADAHGGRVTCANCPEGGAAFTLRFPVHQPRMQRMAA